MLQNLQKYRQKCQSLLIADDKLRKSTNLKDIPKVHTLNATEIYYKFMIKPVEALAQKNENLFTKCSER